MQRHRRPRRNSSTGVGTSTAARLGYSDGTSPIYNESVSLGLIRKFQYRSDLPGISANWGSPPDESLRDQTTVEAFWRFQFAQNLAITPSVQLLLDPALNAEHDEVWVYGLRMRMSFQEPVGLRCS